MTTPSYDEIRQQVERRYRRRVNFIFHIIISAILSGMIWVFAPVTSIGLVIIALLMVSLLLHSIKLLLDGWRDREIERTWQRYYGDLPYEKPKREMLHLTDDGELEVIEEETQDRKMMRGG